MREKKQRRECEIDDEKKIPGDASAREGIPEARAEGRGCIEKDVAGNAGGVDAKEKREGRKRVILFATASRAPDEEKASEPSESKRKYRQADERMREAAMVTLEGKRVARELDGDDVDVGEDGAESRGNNGDAHVTPREKSFANESAGDAVGDGVHIFAGQE